MRSQTDVFEHKDRMQRVDSRLSKSIVIGRGKAFYARFGGESLCAWGRAGRCAAKQGGRKS